MQVTKCLLGIPLLLFCGCNMGRELTPLIQAARNGSADTVRVLLRQGADPNQPGGVNGWTPLLHAIHKNQPSAVRALLEGGANINGRGRSGETPLMMAAGYGYTPIVELLLARGADTRAVDADGDNALSLALGGVPDIDRFTLGACQVSTVQALKRKDPGLHLPDNLRGRTAKLPAAMAKLRGCAY
jgi:hypothetical protein